MTWTKQTEIKAVLGAREYFNSRFDVKLLIFEQKTYIIYPEIRYIIMFLCIYSAMDSTQVSGACSRGSTPLRCTKIIAHEKIRALFVLPKLFITVK